MRRSSRTLPWQSSAKASPRSASSERSWNSSNSTAPMPDSSGSSRIMRVNTPSVTTSMRVFGPDFDTMRARKPIRSPTASDNECAMRSAAARAAMRRGSSTRILRPCSQPSSIRARGTRVVLPAPGGATRTAELRAAKVARSSSRTASIGSGAANCIAAVSGGHVPSASTMCGRRRRLAELPPRFMSCHRADCPDIDGGADEHGQRAWRSTRCHSIEA